jgi:predicted signal transduction protein with EAL and GGDEF domain
VAEPFLLGATKASIGVSIGVAIAPDNGTDREDLLRRADLALYRAKAEGRSLIRFFETNMDAKAELRASLEHELRAALAAGTIEPYYQPLIDITDDRVIGFEALARWSNLKHGAVPPSVFIALAEECGLIYELGDQLLRKACNEAILWSGDLILAFNVSPLQLRDRTLGLRILRILGETGLNPRRLELEITESAIVSDAVAARHVIDELRSAGVRIALDDFGTGYATMSQLVAFRFDKIKIDRSFVDLLGKDPQSDVIVRATIGLAKGLGLTTIAEGVEGPDQLAALKAEGCAQAQGYLFGKAIPAGEIAALLGKRKRESRAS